MKQSQKTIRLLQSYKLAGSLMFILPVIVPYWQSKGLDQAQIGWLQTIFTAMVLILQLPTGRLADKYGRRRLILVGSILAALGFVLYAIAGGFWGMVAAEMLLGVGYSCKSGADLALLRHELEEDDRLDEEKHWIGRLNSFSAGGELVSAIIGGWLGSIAFGLPLWLTVAGISLAIPFAAALPKDKPREQSAHKQLGMIKALRALFANKRMRAISSFAVTAGVATHLFVWLLQPYLKATGLPLSWFGLAWALYSASFLVLSWRISSIERRLGERHSMAVALLAPVVAYIVLGLGMTLWLAPIMILFTLSRALNGPITTHLVHENSNPRDYATMLSALAAIQGLTYAVLGPLSGWIVDTYGLQTDLLFLGILVAIASLVSYQLLRRHHLSITKV
jgi:MFS family permease